MPAFPHFPERDVLCSHEVLIIDLVVGLSTLTLSDISVNELNFLDSTLISRCIYITYLEFAPSQLDSMGETLKSNSF